MNDLPPPVPSPSPTPDAAPNPPVPAGAPAAAWWRRKLWKLPTWAWIAVVVVIVAGAAGSGRNDRSSASGGDSATSDAPTTVASDSGSSAATPAATSTVVAATTAAPTLPPTTLAATTIPTTTTTTTTTIPATTTTVPTLLLKGSGDDVVEVPAGNTAFILIAGHDGRRNFIVHALDANLEYLDSAVNEIGPYIGTTLVNKYGDPADIRYFEVQADGNWQLELVGIDRVPTVSEPSFQGQGSQVLLYTGTGGIFTIDHQGESNFIVHFISADNSDGVVNEIGNYSGRKPIASGPALLEINADGMWSFTKN